MSNSDKIEALSNEHSESFEMLLLSSSDWYVKMSSSNRKFWDSLFPKEVCKLSNTNEHVVINKLRERKSPSGFANRIFTVVNRLSCLCSFPWIMRLAVIFLLRITLVDMVVGTCVCRMVCVLVLDGRGVGQSWASLVVVGSWLLFVIHRLLVD